MSYKRPFDDVMREFEAKYPDEVANLTPGQIAERTGYSFSTVDNYFFAQSAHQYELEKKAEEEKQIRAKEGEIYTYVTSSGKARVDYYSLLGEAKVTSTYTRMQVSEPRDGQTKYSTLLSAEDTLEISIYLLGLQPHIRDVLAQKDTVVQETPVEYPTQDMADQDM